MKKSRSIPDHPDIARALQTGYSRHYKTIRCVDCGSEMYGAHLIYIDNGDVLCGSCLKERIEDGYSIDDLAEALDVRKATAGDYLEELEDPD